MEDPIQNSQPKVYKQSTNVVTVLIVIGLLYISFLLYQSVYQNYQTNRKIENLRADLKNLSQDKQRLQSLIAYYQTPSFQELEARKKLGMKKPDEIVVKVDVPQDSNPTPTLAPADATISQKSNPEKWLDFLRGEFF